MSLAVENVSVSIAGVDILRDVSLNAPSGKITSLIGANGAGKTTLLRAISRLIPVAQGQIRLASNEITKTAPHMVSRMGLAHVPQGRMIIDGLNVMENLMIGAEQVGIAASSADGRDRIDEAFALFPRLAERRDIAGVDLSGGEQQMLAVARALVVKPSVIMLDEPSLGLAPNIVSEIFDTLKNVADTGVAVLLVEQRAWGAIQISDSFAVLQRGEIVMQKAGSEAKDNAEFINAYLGT